MADALPIAVALALAATGAAVAPSGGAAADAIGVARQEADGTIVLQLRAEGPGGLIGDGLLRYPPADRNYAMVARHVGPIPQGGSVPVRPFTGDER